METKKVIKLDQFLKLSGLASSGGEAKQLILNGKISVNGEIETRRGRQLAEDDRVEVGGEHFLVSEHLD